MVLKGNRNRNIERFSFKDATCLIATLLWALVQMMEFNNLGRQAFPQSNVLSLSKGELHAKNDSLLPHVPD